VRSRLPLISLVLAATLLAGQWLAATHDSDHAQQPGAAHVCAVCVYAHGAGTGALPVVAQLNLDGAGAAPDNAAVANPLAITSRHHPIRGPPALLV